MPNRTRLLLPLLATLTCAAARAQYAEGFDAQATADVTVLAGPDTNVAFVDYGALTVGALNFSIPEAPRRIPGSAPTRGVLLQANLTAGAPGSVNLLAGATPIPFTGRYRVSFDAWINVPAPLPNGSTEQLLWGVSVDGTGPIEARHNIALGTQGVFGWLAGENGYASEDAVICEGGLRLAQRGDTQAGQAAFFNDAFDRPVVVGAANNSPANQWVRVDIDVDGTAVRVYHNGVEFFSATATQTPAGFAMLGYEDPFASLGSLKDAQWGLFDNFRVVVPTGCGTPGLATLQGTATGGAIRNGAALPAVGCPMTVRLRGGPASGLVALSVGFPAPQTIPIPFGTCTLGAEVINLGLLFQLADPLGGSLQTIEVPANPGLCGVALGFQYFFPTIAGCGLAHTEGLALTVGS